MNMPAFTAEAVLGCGTARYRGNRAFRSQTEGKKVVLQLRPAPGSVPGGVSSFGALCSGDSVCEDWCNDAVFGPLFDSPSNDAGDAPTCWTTDCLFGSQRSCCTF